jgi:hypothetical protein
MPNARLDAAEILRRIIAAMPMPASMAAYLRGHADGLEARPRRRRRPPS